jgi:hypothetical protein
MKLLSSIKGMFASKEKPAPVVPRAGAKLYECGGGWGNAINFINYPEQVYGFKRDFPVRGDILTCAMQSGKTLVLIFNKIEPCGDPSDMFFASVTPAGYTDEIKFTLPK